MWHVLFKNVPFNDVLSEISHICCVTYSYVSTVAAPKHSLLGGVACWKSSDVRHSRHWKLRLTAKKNLGSCLLIIQAKIIFEIWNIVYKYGSLCVEGDPLTKRNKRVERCLLRKAWQNTHVPMNMRQNMDTHAERGTWTWPWTWARHGHGHGNEHGHRYRHGHTVDTVTGKVMGMKADIIWT